jgi:predicted acylesterase/phospholipase RssA
LTGCVSVQPRNPLPADQVDVAAIAGIPQARFWGDDISPFLEQEMNTLTREQIRNDFPALYGQPHNYLAISGGGADGAFGAGLLFGWTEAGSRPEFQMVTGISTGALIAPFAFLGPEYDDVLRTVYTGISTSDILKKRSILSLATADAATDTTPLKKLLEQYVDDEVIEAIAREHRRGRGLYIGTTDADYMRPMIWDIGAIAASGAAGAKSLVQQVMLASASVPGAMPPVRIEVTAGGRVYDELHIDGGTATQVFVYPAATDWRRVLELLDVPETPNIYVIRNSSLEPYRDVVEPKLAPIAIRSLSSLIRTQGIGDLYMIYMLAQRDGARYRLAHIPNEFTERPTEPFDTPYMNELFELGFDLARQGYPWASHPPGWELEEP